MPTPLQHKRASALVDKAAKLLKEREPRWEATRRAVGPAMAQLVNTRGAVRAETVAGRMIFDTLKMVGLAKDGPHHGTFVATSVGLGYKPTPEEWQIAMDAFDDGPMKKGRASGRSDAEGYLRAVGYHRTHIIEDDLDSETGWHIGGPIWIQYDSGHYDVISVDEDGDAEVLESGLSVEQALHAAKRLAGPMRRQR